MLGAWGSWVKVLALRPQGLRFRTANPKNLGSEVQGSGFRAEGLGFTQGLHCSSFLGSVMVFWVRDCTQEGTTYC